jgi:prepilin-type N-terminal cleavage/methylation domain-containing protein
MLPFPNKRRIAGGFTLLETMMAMVIFAVGVLALAALMSTVNLNTERSRYMHEATTMASEKLEDLSRYPAASAADALTVGGSLNSDVTAYFDDVQVSADNGALTEITYNENSVCYDVFTQNVNGTATDTCVATKPTALTGAFDFHRRWMVENPITVNGNSVNVRRITVLVSLWSQSTNAAISFQGQPVTYQLSTVRP